MTLSKNIIILLAVLAVIFAIALWNVIPESKRGNSVTAAQNTKALIGGPFSLIDHHGKKVSNEDYRGKYMLIYFGYTFCPDVCPMELQIMATALDQLPKKTLAEITPLFITLDPERDTVEVMAQYAPAFHSKLIGLTGSMEQIKAVKKAYRVYGAREKLDEGADPGSYLVSHTSYIYLMDRNGEYVTHFKSRTDPDEMAKRLEDIIR
ncbi:Cytochrome oxidase biogenesis protein Sco1/SenC/PrrC, thiol-disulfide reductase involved in Cu(I) insertion into CoxII Cu(A) center [hydrothermal vent metagenome]|uniref:Cytochrome oxidase biogenesis protein Sco1/SenC/PrrC, thiol-disulfide reductase involved in Cu(I) insertion into CoxII Cu(A) center n=1 Tax=hydrothermal vent metagenome TaxID=652676 RepID=A0A3B0RCR9_9ZZZZ